METPLPPAPALPAEAVPQDSPSLSVLQRAGRIYASPADAWVGLERRAQWWFPLIVIMLVSACSIGILFQRAIVPTITDRWDQDVQSGRMTTEQVQKMTDFISGPAGLAVVGGQQVIFVAIITLVTGVLIWFGCGFVLGTRLSYRLALEVAAWSSLVNIPVFVLSTALGWMKGTMKGVHTGFGILLPEPDTPSKLLTGLGTLLDGVGPFMIWYMVVVVLGAAALSGANRRSVAWVLGGLYLALLVFFAALAAVFAPSAT